MTERVEAEAPTFRVGVLADQNLRSLAAILNHDRDELARTHPTGSMALEVPFLRGHKLVEEHSAETVLRDFSSVSEAIVMRLGGAIDPLH